MKLTADQLLKIAGIAPTTTLRTRLNESVDGNDNLTMNKAQKTTIVSNLDQWIKLLEANLERARFDKANVLAAMDDDQFEDEDGELFNAMVFGEAFADEVEDLRINQNISRFTK